jgi:hypothetical protein
LVGSDKVCRGIWLGHGFFYPPHLKTHCIEFMAATGSTDAKIEMLQNLNDCPLLCCSLKPSYSFSCSVAAFK